VTDLTEAKRRGYGRREILGAASFFMGAGLLPNAARAVTVAEAFPIVETAQGRVQGISNGGIKGFRGLHYGGDTSGRNRFMPPPPPVSWKGVREAFSVGPISPQQPASHLRAYSNIIQMDAQPGGMSEDCLVLNVWTPTLDPNAKRPVMVYLHGGGFYAGSGGNPRMDGENLARFGDAVVVTINHRLGAFGYLHLVDSGAPAAFAQSGSVGMLDIVAALRWVRENITAFGGDPSRVLVFGQSGGGRKTGFLLGMPAAKGLFHRAGIMSGAMTEAMEREVAAKAADQLLAVLGLKGADVGKLQQIPMLSLLAAQFTMEETARKRGEAPRLYGPVLDGTAIPRHPFTPQASELSRDVPLICSTCLDERSYRLVNYDLDDAGFRAFAAKRVGAARADEVARLYRAEDPGAPAFLLQARLDTDTDHRVRANRLLESKVRQGGAPAWSYLWKQPSPTYGGRYGAPHATDVGPSLQNAYVGLTGTSAVDIALMDQISSQWVSFAATGDPNNNRLPAWEPYSLERRATMIYDRNTRVENDPRAAFRKLWADYRPTADAE